ncbi:MAG TPA: hypothetical protein VGX76_20435 [Pirellulales bacterium]|nr:hypothetical protein [Pirellulales bacterium]
MALGGSVAIGTAGQPESRIVNDAADLPRDYFQVRRVSLAGVAKPLDKLPEHLGWLRFPEFDRLESLDLSRVTGLDYGFLAAIHGLEELSLANVEQTDESLVKVQNVPALKRLSLDNAGLTDESRPNCRS